MYFVGSAPVLARRLTAACHEAMWRGIREVKPGARLGDIGHAIQTYAESNNFSVVREYCGHGIGRDLSRGSPGAALRQTGYRPRTHDGHDLYHRTHDQCRAAATCGCCPTAGPWSPRISRCRRSGSTRFWSRTSGFEVLTLGASVERCPPPRRPLERPRQVSRSTRRLALSDGRTRRPAGRPILSRSFSARCWIAAPSCCKERFVADEAIEDLVRDRARLVDIALRAAWVRHAGKFADDLALVAVGGYGRGELHPSSDIDIMVLLPKSDSADWQPDIEKLSDLSLGHRSRSRPQRALHRRLPAREPRRHQRCDHAVRSAAAGRARIAVRRHAPRAGAGPPLVLAGLLRSQGQGADRAASSLLRHRLQPRTQRQIESGGPARHSDHRLGGETPLRHRHARRAGGARLPHPRGAAQAQGGPIVSVEGALRAARAHRPARGPAAVRLPDQAREDVRLRGRELHAGGRAADAEVLPHGHGHQPAERNAAAAVSRGHPDAKRRRRCPSMRASRSATIIWK